jgi:hypothetical protein
MRRDKERLRVKRRKDRRMGCMFKGGLIVAMAFLCTFAAPIYSYPELWGPFEEGKEPGLLPVEECQVIEEGYIEEGLYKKIYEAPGEETKVKLEASADGVVLSILRKEEVVAGPTKISEVAFDDWKHYYFVGAADLNKDGKEDFVIGIWSRFSLGMRSGSYEMVFALSEEETYKITAIYDINPTKHRLIDIKGDGSAQYLQSALIYGVHEPSQLDGEGKNFFVYNLLEIKGSTVRLNNEIDESFPRWVRIGEDKLEDHLTSAQKKRLLEEGDLLGRVPRIFVEKQEKRDMK